ncbi:MAG: hypothetical protein GX161_06445 [Firmicutes bacterium]|mgnify:CR=1 FL=1|nr:hypothetical protein [Bacillota bacterium]
MRRIWFQFRKEAAPEVKGASGAKAALEARASSEGPGPAERTGAGEGQGASEGLRADKEERLALRLTGWLWVVPLGPYRSSILEGVLKGWSGEEGPRVEEAALHLGGGEMRRLRFLLTRPAEERAEVTGFDVPIAAQVRIRTSLAELRLGDLTLPGSLAAGDAEPQGGEEFARGTAVFRWAAAWGTLHDEPFRVRLIELDRVQLVQGELAWTGRMFQSVADRVPKGSGRALYQYLRRSASVGDLLPRLRYGAERWQRTEAAGPDGPSGEERDHKAREEVQDGEDDDHDG